MKSAMIISLLGALGVGGLVWAGSGGRPAGDQDEARDPLKEEMAELRQALQSAQERIERLEQSNRELKSDLESTESEYKALKRELTESRNASDETTEPEPRSLTMSRGQTFYVPAYMSGKQVGMARVVPRRTSRTNVEGRAVYEPIFVLDESVKEELRDQAGRSQEKTESQEADRREPETSDDRRSRPRAAYSEPRSRGARGGEYTLPMVNVAGNPSYGPAPFYYPYPYPYPYGYSSSSAAAASSFFFVNTTNGIDPSSLRNLFQRRPSRPTTRREPTPTPTRQSPIRGAWAPAIVSGGRDPASEQSFERIPGVRPQNLMRRASEIETRKPATRKVP